MSAPLDPEEYIEQAYFFRTYRERLGQNIAAQDIIAGIHEEVLATTKLPMALDFLRGEMLLNGRIGDGMQRLQHYFTRFQTYVISRAEDDRSRFDLRTALEILEREAEYRAGAATPAGLFIFQFECLSRNSLGFDRGLQAMADDPLYDPLWRDWVLFLRRQLGSIDFADLIYFHSQQRLLDHRAPLVSYATEDVPATASAASDAPPVRAPLFGAKEGRIARANRGKDPLFMFAALQRQLGYPAVPRSKRSSVDDRLSPAALEAKITQLEKRVNLMEAEARGNLDLSEFYTQPQNPPPETPEV